MRTVLGMQMGVTYMGTMAARSTPSLSASAKWLKVSHFLFNTKTMMDHLTPELSWERDQRATLHEK